MRWVGCEGGCVCSGWVRICDDRVYMLCEMGGVGGGVWGCGMHGCV